MEGFGARVRAARMAVGLRQADVADKLGYDQSMVSKWEREEVEPSKADYIAIGKVLGADPAYLMGLPEGENVLSDKQQQILTLGWELARLDPDIRFLTLHIGRALNSYPAKQRLLDGLSSREGYIRPVDDSGRRRGRRARKEKPKLGP